MSVFESPSAPKPQRQPSFVGLPPISPGPEFGSALGISPGDLDDPHRAVSPPGHLQGPSPHPHYLDGGGNRIANAIFNTDNTATANNNNNNNNNNNINTRANTAFSDSRNGARPGPVPGASPLASPTMNYQLQSSSPHPHGTQFMQGPYVMMQSPHVQQPAAHHFQPAAHQFSANGSGNGNPNIMHHQAGPSQPGYPGQKGPVSYQQFQSSSPPPGMPSPSLMSNGQFNVPPGWKMEQSQLQQPLSSPRHRHSPSISSLKQQNQAYEIDKETGAPSARSVSPPTHSPVDSRRPGQPALVSSAGPSSQNGEFRPPNAPFMMQTQGAALARSSTNITQNSQFHDEPESKRNSNVFSSIRNRLAGSGNDQRDAMTGRPQPNGGLTGDDVSDASIPVDDQGRRVPSNFFGLRGNGQPNGDGTPFSTQGLSGASFSPPKEKRPFFSRPSGLGINSSQQEVSRPATAEGVMGPPVVGFGPGQPKKRFSKLTGMLNRDKTENQPSQPLGYGATQGQRPSFQGQRPPGGAMGYSDQMSPHGGPGDDGQMSGYGRPRSSTAGSRPSISDHGRTPSGQGYGPPAPMGPIAEEDRGRKPSGGNLLSNIFGKRSDSKNREHAQQRPPRSPPGLDQPQGLNPQGQITGKTSNNPLGVVQVATAVPIRQVGNSPNGNSGQFQGGISPGAQSDSSRQRSASVVNQIDVGGARKPSVDLQGTRNRAASQSLAQQHPVHIASLHAPSRHTGNSSSPRNSPQFQPQDAPSHGAQNQENGTPVSSGQLGASFPPQARRVSQGVMAGQQLQGSDQQQAVSVQSSPSASPAPNPGQQVSPPGVPPKNSPAPSPGQGFGSTPTQSWQNPGVQSQSAPMAQQSSVYRPSGPQIAAVVQSFSQQQPQSPWSIGRQNGFGQPGPPGQQFMPGQSPQGMMMTSPPQEQRSEKEGTFSKFLKSSKTFVHQISDSQSLNDKPKPEKENKGMKSMMGVFKRPAKESKQPESGKAPPGGPQWAIQSGQVPPSMQQYGSSQSPQGKPTAQRLPQMQMPPKAQQVMGIGEGEQKIPVEPQEQAPQAQASQSQAQAYGTGQPSPELPRAQQPRITSQPYPDNQNERPSPQKTSPPLGQQQARQPQSGRPSISGDASRAPYEMPPQQQQQQQQQPRRPSQPPIGQTQSQTPAATSGNMRAHNPKQQTAQRAPEPQYAPVPIPQGYATVHGEGMAAAKPNVMGAPPYGQPLPMPQSGMPYQGPPQQWVYPGMAPGQMPAGMPPQMVQQGWPQYPPYQGTPPPMVMAQHPPPQQQYMPGQHATPSPPLQGQQAPPHMPAQQHGPQPQVHPQFMAAAPGHHRNVPEQTVSPSHNAGFAPAQQAAPALADAAQAAPDNGQPHAAPQPQQQLSPVPDASPVIPVHMDKGGRPQLHQPEAVKSEFAQTTFQTVPRSAFAVVKPQPGQDQLQPHQGSNLIPQRQTSGASEVSSLTSVPATNQAGSSTQSSETIHQVQQQAANVSPERIVISPEPVYERPPVTLTDNPPKTESPATTASAEQEDIYGATPRQSRHVSPVLAKEHQQQQQQQNVMVHSIDRSSAQEPSGEPEAKFAGPLPNRSPETKPAAKNEPSPAQQSFVVDVPPVIIEPATAITPSAPSPGPRVSTSKSMSPEGVEPPSPTDSELGKKRESDSSGNTKEGDDGINGGAANGASSSKPVQTSQEIFEEHKRKQLVRDMEEKIALNPTEPDSMLMLGPGGKKKGEDAPLMSATSYPGQEWNPYGDAWIDDDL
ncbi:hypothetical protein INS49_001222 [Diaporthe citri]|uniref:uncharacterized protein n=1 Tax=Diaporthe citri TaxID=83186 RepID=UPI001C7EB59F|nr:uncharacterized protein INS49_001222 [Diaporthe citri]KAG6367040.1 hypothetical protein INS49_001222 [Diaporthe citri]